MNQSWKQERKLRHGVPSDDKKEPEYIYDGDTGTAFVNGFWRVVSQTQWERWQRSLVELKYKKAVVIAALRVFAFAGKKNLFEKLEANYFVCLTDGWGEIGMRIKVKSIEYYGYNLTIYDKSSDYPLNGPWYLVAIENSLGKELFTRSPIKGLDTALAEGKKIVDRKFRWFVEPRSAVEIFILGDDDRSTLR